MLDTNVFVAAGFRPGGACGALLAAARAGRIAALWSEETRAETRAVLMRIPPLDWDDAAALFRPEHRWTPALDFAAVAFVEDLADRKFAALARDAGALLVSADGHLLDHAARLGAARPTEALRRLGLEGAGRG